MNKKKLETIILLCLIGIPLILAIITYAKVIKEESENKTETKEQIETVAVDKEAEKETEVATPSEIETLNTNEEENKYLTYIPVYYDGEERNLYDLADDDYFIFYLYRPDCPDCQEYEDDILDTLAESNIAYVPIQTSKTPKEVDGGFSMESAIATDIGIEAVPSFIFIKEGKAVQKFDKDYGDGSEVKQIINDLYYDGQNVFEEN